MCTEGEDCSGQLWRWAFQGPRRRGGWVPAPSRLPAPSSVTDTSGGCPPLRQVLRQHSINLSEEEFFHILEYYDKTLSSKISYNDFLRAFLQ